MNNILLDTGPLIAILDKRDKAHKRCVSFVKGFRGNLLMTEPVLTEAAYLLRSAKYFKNCVSLVSAGQIHIYPFNNKRLLRCVELMEQYKYGEPIRLIKQIGRSNEGLDKLPWHFR